jgi:hypothetical protein
MTTMKPSTWQENPTASFGEVPSTMGKDENMSELSETVPEEQGDQKESGSGENHENASANSSRNRAKCNGPGRGRGRGKGKGGGHGRCRGRGKGAREDL